MAVGPQETQHTNEGYRTASQQAFYISLSLGPQDTAKHSSLLRGKWKCLDPQGSIWVRKDQNQLIPPAPKVFKPVAPDDTGKVLILCPPQSLETTQTSTPSHLDSACMDIGDPHTVTVSHEDDDNQVLVFPPPRQRVLTDQDQLKLKEIDALKIAPPSIISPRIHSGDIQTPHPTPTMVG